MIHYDLWADSAEELQTNNPLPNMFLMVAGPAFFRDGFVSSRAASSRDISSATAKQGFDGKAAG